MPDVLTVIAAPVFILRLIPFAITSCLDGCQRPIIELMSNIFPGVFNFGMPESTESVVIATIEWLGLRLASWKSRVTAHRCDGSRTLPQWIATVGIA